MTNALLKNGLFGCEISGAFSAQAIFGRMEVLELAGTRGLMATGTVSAEHVNAALASFDAAGFRVTNDRDGLPVPPLAAQLRSKPSLGASSAIHAGPTSKDVIDTAMVLSAPQRWTALTGGFAASSPRWPIWNANMVASL